MTPPTLAHDTTAALSTTRRPGAEIVRFVMDRFLLLPLGAALALLWANTAPESYFRFAHVLAFSVNEIGMALFLALVAQEVFEAVMPGGALHRWRRWGMALVGAAGGLLGATLAYLAYIYLKHETVLAQAWPIVGSIDIAASYYVLKTIWRRSRALPFLLLLAIATDAVGLVLLAAWAPVTQTHLIGAALVIGAVGLSAFMRRSRVRSFWPHLAFSGPISWVGFSLAGVHPALALVPLVPFLPHEPRRLDLFADPGDDDEVHHAEHRWTGIVQVVLFLFGLVNAGVILRQFDTGTWAVLAAALVGRPAGILAAVALALAIGFHLPRGLGWRELLVIACATSSGFTVTLFFAAGFLPPGAVLQQIKLGALCTVVGALLAIGLARRLRVGRFARPVPG